MAKKDHKSRAHALLSASGAELWLNCTASAVACAQYPNEESAYTLEGTLAHEVAEAFVAGQALPETEGITQEMVACAQGYADCIRERTSDTAVVLLEQRLDFSAWVPGGFGTGDCIIIDNGTLTIVDYKYGQGVPVSAEDNPQMRLYALGAINDYGCLYDFDTVCMVIYQPRINNLSESRLSVPALLDWAERELRPRAAEAYSGEGRYTAGPHCRKFCRHAGRCPALRDYCSDFVETHGLRVAVPHLTDDQIVEVVRMEPLIRMWLDRVTRTAADRILGGEKVEGLKLVEGRSLRRWSDARDVEIALRQAGYGDDQIMTEPELLSVAAMEKALGRKKVAEIVGDHIRRNPGKPTLVEASDKRPDFDPGAEFDRLD